MAIQVLSAYLGCVDYEFALHLQKQAWQYVRDHRASGVLLLLEHPPTITLGKNSDDSFIICAKEELVARGIKLSRSDRGGEVTVHNPGQLVIYPMINLRLLGCGVRKFADMLQQSVLQTLKFYGVQGELREKHPGIWLNYDKICAMGLRIDRHVSRHGLALNVANNLDHFGLVVPCGISGTGVTSLSEILARPIDVLAVAKQFTEAFARVFALQVITQGREQLLHWLADSPNMGEAVPH